MVNKISLSLFFLIVGLIIVGSLIISVISDQPEFLGGGFIIILFIALMWTVIPSMITTMNNQTNESNITEQNFTIIDINKSQDTIKRNNKTLILDTNLLNTNELLDLGEI